MGELTPGSLGEEGRGARMSTAPKAGEPEAARGGMPRFLNEEGPGYLDPWVLGEKTRVGALGSRLPGLRDGGGRTPRFPRKAQAGTQDP